MRHRWDPLYVPLVSTLTGWNRYMGPGGHTFWSFLLQHGLLHPQGLVRLCAGVIAWQQVSTHVASQTRYFPWDYTWDHGYAIWSVPVRATIRSEDSSLVGILAASREWYDIIVGIVSIDRQPTMAEPTTEAMPTKPSTSLPQ